MTALRLLAIINPISGTHSGKEYVPEVIERVIDPKKYEVTVRFTQYAGHATTLARQAIEDNYYGVLVIGGDGTINEIATALRNSNVALGIIPCGSGNGLARHLEIPMELEEALKVINENHIEPFDYGMVNDRPFFCTCGVGFDAHVSKKFAESKTRGPMTYLKNTLLEYIKYKCEDYVIECDGKILSEKAFVIACGNASQYGNNAFITPHADMQDGKLDVTVIHPFTPLDTAMIGLLLFAKHIDQDANIYSFRTKEFTIHRPKSAVMHLDGEPIMMSADLHIRIVHYGIRIFVQKEDEPKKKSVIQVIDEGFWGWVSSIRKELNV